MTDYVRTVLLPKLEAVKPCGGQFIARCPVPDHADGRPSLSIGCGENGKPLINCFAGCLDDDVIAAVRLTWKDLGFPWTEREPTGPDDWLPCWKDHGRAGHRLVASYPYCDADGRVHFTVTRCEAKDFAQWRPDLASRTGRRWNITEKAADGTTRRLVPYLPYQLPAVLHAIAAGLTVWVVEGERDVERLAEVGITATTNSGGGSGATWRAEHAAYLAGADVVVVADRDKTGWAHAEQVVTTLLPVARSIEVVRAAEGKDARDHLDAGFGIHQFVHLATPIPAPTRVDGCPDCAAEAAG